MFELTRDVLLSRDLDYRLGPAQQITERWLDHTLPVPHAWDWRCLQTSVTAVIQFLYNVGFTALASFSRCIVDCWIFQRLHKHYPSWRNSCCQEYHKGSIQFSALASTLCLLPGLRNVFTATELDTLTEALKPSQESLYHSDNVWHSACVRMEDDAK